MSPNLSWTQSLNDKQWKTNSVFRLKLQTASVKIVQFYVHCQNYFWQPQNPLDTMITSPSWRLTEAKGNMSTFSPCLDFHECDLLFLNKTGSLKMRFWFVCFFICRVPVEALNTSSVYQDNLKKIKHDVNYSEKNFHVGVTIRIRIKRNILSFFLMANSRWCLWLQEVQLYKRKTVLKLPLLGP